MKIIITRAHPLFSTLWEISENNNPFQFTTTQGTYVVVRNRKRLIINF